MRSIIVTTLILLLVGCDAVNTNTAPATFTPLPMSTDASIDGGCELVSASSVVVGIEEQRANAPRILPNGQSFPGKAPRNIENRGRGRQRQDGRIEVMVQFTGDSSPADRNAYIRDIGGTSRRQIDQLNTYVVVLNPNTQLADLPASPIVIRTEVNETASATQINQPNDPRFGEQWGLPIMGLPQAWMNIPTGQVTVAVVDSGICSGHADLVGRIVSGYDFVDDDNDPADTFGHGCGVAGVIAAVANNGIGIAGIAPNTMILPLRVLGSDGMGNYADISAAIVYAADNGADIINLSLAGTAYSEVMAEAVAYAISRGVVVVAAAGNQGSDATFYPAAFPSIIGVGSIDPNLSRSSFSNYGANIDVVAPGRDILTTSMNGDYEFMSGTSFAAPAVAGLLAISELSGADLQTEDGIAFVYPPNTTLQCN